MELISSAGEVDGPFFSDDNEEEEKENMSHILYKIVSYRGRCKFLQTIWFSKF